ncbi:hypothetical protein Ga0123462_1873 [Mariprofundus ferrinatatus]|uniref:Uncharacterized protein n=1 Tax=Mariprofundus ferrinatatus TaxID=1921087 RepID=A0A2K8L5W1_9PROT|nr:hypothetical protein [Mariprofundus ferrinatatus]ATX82715.1 hypothetical protein Ga0123462_1873 [Mariprofundus ferrinatatus]
MHDKHHKTESIFSDIRLPPIVSRMVSLFAVLGLVVVLIAAYRNLANSAFLNQSMMPKHPAAISLKAGPFEYGKMIQRLDQAKRDGADAG